MHEGDPKGEYSCGAYACCDMHVMHLCCMYHACVMSCGDVHACVYEHKHVLRMCDACEMHM